MESKIQQKLQSEELEARVKLGRMLVLPTIVDIVSTFQVFLCPCAASA